MVQRCRAVERLFTTIGTHGNSDLTPGIGLALAKQFLAAGDKVCLCARDAVQLEAQCQELGKEHPGQTLSKATDVTKASEVAALADFVKEKMGHADIWINNAGEAGMHTNSVC